MSSKKNVIDCHFSRVVTIGSVDCLISYVPHIVPTFESGEKCTLRMSHFLFFHEKLGTTKPSHQTVGWVNERKKILTSRFYYLKISFRV